MPKIGIIWVVPPHFFKPLFLLSVITAALPVLAQTSVIAQQDEDHQFVVDAIDLQGTSMVSREFVKATLDVPLDTPMTRPEIDRRLLEGRNRLEGLGQFEKVDIKVERGKEKFHYVIVVDLSPYSSYYWGGGASATFSNQKTTETQLFTGTRDLAGTGTMLDLEVRDREWNSHGCCGSDNKYSGDTKIARVSVFRYDIADTPIFAGLAYIYGNSRYNRYQNDESEDFHVIQNSVTAKIGIREGAYSLGLTGRRLWRFSGESPVEGRLYSPDNTLGLDGTYSEKSNLTEVEPGIVTRVGVKTYGSNANRPTFTANLEWTYIFLGKHALTPSLQMRRSYGAVCTDNNCSWDLFKNAEVTLLYQYVMTSNWVLGVETGVGAWQSRYGSDVGLQHIGLSASYISHNMIFKLALTTGYPLKGSELPSESDRGQE